VLAGDFGRLADLRQRKEALFKALAAGVLDPANLRRIGADVARNQALLMAAMAGISDATQRLAELRTARDGFLAYGRDGQREPVSSMRPSLERKV
jgi:hypothetical protein